MIKGTFRLICPPIPTPSPSCQLSLPSFFNVMSMFLFRTPFTPSIYLSIYLFIYPSPASHSFIPLFCIIYFPHPKNHHSNQLNHLNNNYNYPSITLATNLATTLTTKINHIDYHSETLTTTLAATLSTISHFQCLSLHLKNQLNCLFSLFVSKLSMFFLII